MPKHPLTLYLSFDIMSDVTGEHVRNHIENTNRRGSLPYGGFLSFHLSKAEETGDKAYPNATLTRMRKGCEGMLLHFYNSVVLCI